MSLRFSVGNLTVHHSIERRAPVLLALKRLLQLVPELLADSRAWLKRPRRYGTDVLILYFRYFITTSWRTILVDRLHRQ